MIKRAFFIPFVIFLAAFTVDKLFLLDSFPLYYLTTASFINFEHKQRLIYQLKDYLNQPKNQRKNVLVIVGNSRSFSFDLEYIQNKYPDWILFNFSVPGGKQDYFLYLMQEFKKNNIKPEAILFSVTPQAMNAKPAVLTDEVMVFGLPASFIFSNFMHYNVDEITNYIGKKLFVVYRYRPKIRVIEHRLKKGNLISFINFLIKTENVLEKNYGNIPSKIEFKTSASEDVIEQNAKSLFNDFFVPFVIDKNAFYFIEECIKISKSLEIPYVALFWPPISKPLLQKKKTEKTAIVYENHQRVYKTVYDVWYPPMVKMVDNYKIGWIDLNVKDPLRCNSFFDASHLASVCYNEYTDKIFEYITGGKK